MMNTNQRKTFYASLSLLSFLVMNACSQGFHPSARLISENISDSVGCSSFKDKVYRTLFDVAGKDGSLPKLKYVDAQLARKLKPGTSTLHLEIYQDLRDLYETLSETPFQKTENKTREEFTREDWLNLLTKFELENESTPERKELSDKVRTLIAKIESAATEGQINCPSGTPPAVVPPTSETPGALPSLPVPPTSGTTNPADGNPYFTSLRKQVARPVFGAHKTFAVAYQSCQALQKNILNSQTPFLEGLEFDGRHPDGVGRRRVIASLSTVLKTHPYIHDEPRPETSCFHVEKSPLIYDYGGKPYADTSSNSAIDVFKDSGSGTKTLGIDCSAFVYSSLASAGLRVKKNLSLQAAHVYGMSSAMFADPGANGLSCLAPVTMNKNLWLQSGDIVALPGHVFMIDQVGSDPFGLQGILSKSQCTPQLIRVANFDFSVIQSSPSKGGVGINRILAKDYLETSDKFREAFVDFAVRTCKAKFGEKPGLAKGIATITRHLGTPECFDREIALAGESCLRNCPLP